MSIGKEFAKYVFLNILGMAGLSCYILADTYFVSARLGSDGLAALNIAISSFNFINGIGLMLGIGGATRYVICREQEQIKEAVRYLPRLFSGDWSLDWQFLRQEKFMPGIWPISWSQRTYSGHVGRISADDIQLCALFYPE